MTKIRNVPKPRVLFQSISFSAPSVNCLRGSCAKVTLPSAPTTFTAASCHVKPRTFAAVTERCVLNKMMSCVQLEFLRRSAMKYTAVTEEFHYSCEVVAGCEAAWLQEIQERTMKRLWGGLIIKETKLRTMRVQRICNDTTNESQTK